ncbi:hypothetical protein GJ496_000132 [Pomphorhynchus laevis]|nr:hypothetical protein GJ496_000132 [Pomphorhynchus laevis]
MQDSSSEYLYSQNCNGNLNFDKSINHEINSKLQSNIENAVQSIYTALKKNINIVTDLTENVSAKWKPQEIVHNHLTQLSVANKATMTNPIDKVLEDKVAAESDRQSALMQIKALEYQLAMTEARLANAIMTVKLQKEELRNASKKKF